MRRVGARNRGVLGERLVRFGLSLLAVLTISSACSSYNGFASPSGFAERIPSPSGPEDVVGVWIGGTDGGRVVTVGQVFAVGDIPAGSGLVALGDGRAVPLQGD